MLCCVSAAPCRVCSLHKAPVRSETDIWPIISRFSLILIVWLMLKSLATYVVGCSTHRVHMGLGSSIASTKQLAMAERCSITNTKVRHLGAACMYCCTLPPRSGCPWLRGEHRKHDCGAWARRAYTAVVGRAAPLCPERGAPVLLLPGVPPTLCFV